MLRDYTRGSRINLARDSNPTPDPTQAGDHWVGLDDGLIEMRVCHVEMLLADNLGGLVLWQCNTYKHRLNIELDLQSYFA
jgi:hypothetical protein